MSDGEWDVQRFGATGDAVRLDTASIQAAIDAVAAGGGGAVRFGPGTYRSGTILLRSNVRLRLNAGATLLGSDRLEDYPADVPSFVDAVGQPRGRCLVLAHHARHVGLEGRGTIDGNGAAFAGPGQYEGRPFLVRFVECEDVRVRDVTLRDAAAWVSHYDRCRRVRISGVTIRSRVNHNNDGIDVDGCSDVEVEGCDVDTGDDAICLKTTTAQPCEDVRVRDCRLSSACAAIKIGTESYGDVRRVRVRGCRVEDTGLCGIKVTSMDGAVVEDVTIEDVTMVRTTGPIFVRLGDRGRTYGQQGHGRRPAGRIRRLTLRNITAHVTTPPRPVVHPFTGVAVSPRAFSGVMVTGIPGHPVEDLRVEAVRVEFAGGGDAADAAREPAEQVAEYPEHFYFGVLPAWAWFLRHVRGATFRDVRVSVRDGDGRPSLACDDVSGLRLDGWDDGREGDGPPMRLPRTSDAVLDAARP